MANIKDVAQYANVSVTTVSRVLNGHPYVREEKRKAVEAAIEALEYIQNSNAINLSVGKTRLIGVVIPFVNHPYFSQLLNGISSRALELGYTLVLFQTTYDENKEIEAMEMLKHKQIDGVVITSRAVSWDCLKGYQPYGPIVVCEDNASEHISSVSIHHYDAFTAGMNLLIESGHRRIGYCISRPNSTNSLIRQEAFADAMNRIGASIHEEWLFTNRLSLEDGEQVVHQLLVQGEKPSALLVASDQVAAGIVMECQKQGMTVPGDLAVVGFDNHPISKALNITTIALPFQEVGRALVNSVLMEDKPTRQQYGFEVISRGSVVEQE
ncbi:LacI family DNA-binding transcriptional regulator [Pontibacillus salicampi]|uniref:LacI family DNA-binding transcriptional regulator n=1 Tax=Pontibacillus salicampi TaxID=1449801 RepID=A0ABV6LT32_9BACI